MLSLYIPNRTESWRTGLWLLMGILVGFVVGSFYLLKSKLNFQNKISMKSITIFLYGGFGNNLSQVNFGSSLEEKIFKLNIAISSQRKYVYSYFRLENS